MTSPGIIGAATLFVWLAILPAWLFAEGARPEQLPQIYDLQSSEFAVRQRAMKELATAGPDAIPALADAVIHGDAEVRSRSLGILTDHAVSTQRSRRGPARAALAQLTVVENPLVAAIAAGSLTHIREITSAAAAAELTRLGATVMPVQGADSPSFNVQIRQTWSGGDSKLSLLGDLGPIPWLSMENAPISDAALAEVAKLAEEGGGPTKLYLGASRITGVGLQSLAPLTRLQYLSLKQLPLDDVKLAAMPDFPELQYLGLDGTKVTDEGLKSLTRYSRLQVLWLDHTPVTDVGIAHLRSLTELRTLYLPGTQTAGPGLAELRQLPNLTSISFKGARLAPDSLKHIAQLEHLESLGLDQTSVNDDQLADLAGLTRLRILWLSNTNISDLGLEHLKTLRSLQIVHLSSTDVSTEAVAELQRALPSCQVTLTGRQEQPALPPRNQTPRPPIPQLP